MKRFRLLGIAAGTLVVLAVLAIAVAFNSAFQTWVARRVIASQPGVRATVGSVSAGMKRVELKDLRFDQGGAILNLPYVEIDVPLASAGWGRKVTITRLVAKGWTLDLTKASSGSGTTPPPAEAASTRPAPAANGSPVLPLPAGSAAKVFAGVFTQLQVPADVSIDGVLLEGEVILPESRGRGKVGLTGGGLGTGREGKFDVVAGAALTEPNVKAVDVRGVVVATMDTPRTFTRVAAKFDASATGAKFPQGVKLHADVSAARAATGETYSVGVVAEGQEVISVKAELPRNAQKFDGSWKVDVRDVDVAPFALGVPLPAFTAVGEGNFAGDARFEGVQITGRLNTTLDRLQVIRAELERVGELKIAADFDLAQRGGTFVVQKLEAAINTTQPVATIRALQPFEITPGTGELRTADLTRELVGLALHAVPVAWVAPFIKDIEVAGGQLRGELSATARGGGVTLRSIAPLLIDGVTIGRAGKPLVQRVDVAMNASADYTPQGWQAEVSDFTVKSGEITVLVFDAKAGQLAGKDQSLKGTGKLSANLPALAAHPAFAGKVALSNGDAAVEFVVSLNATKEIQASVALKNLAAIVETNVVKLPALSTNLRADISSDGKIAFNAPIQIEHAERKSDLTLIGTIGPEKEKSRVIDAGVTSTQLFVEDARVLSVMVPNKTGKTGTKDATAGASRDTEPPWAGFHGSVTLQLGNVIYSEAVQMSNVTGRLRVEAGILKLEGLQAGLGETGRANVSGTVTFQSTALQPYVLAADVAVREFDPGPLFRTVSVERPATVEGKFDLTSKLSGRAATFAELAAGAGGNFQLTSKGGVFRGLPVNVGNIVENTSKLAAWIASAGTALSAITGKKDLADVANKAEAVAELAKALNPIPYDQMSVTLSRDAALNTTLRNFTLISPEVRLTGNGTALHKSGSSLLDDSLVMEFTLRARGRQGELLKYLGALEPQADDLGYTTCIVPLKVGGTIGKPDTSEISSKLTALAIEKSGFGDKAAEFLAKIRGGK